ncbi:MULTISPECIES: phosphoglycolate phosphatase [Pseudoalteromonas]|jgi:phosphoglycolate phosphatase|uniref:phosphoglycolate phosphatase n=1 Tax=Pseudoalteromonas TaxID=53246 RepID=UPI000731FBCA|nr:MULTISPECIES: phosphoglycolate phosphatase [Pseudoalteromonas]KTF16482.1 haloacid dehalogenase [Pseudoalteromonas sp. H103]MCQ8890544.1 phosphoglycolate phosphatase [Pseudoalteromonas carrageenovora]MDO6463742.1 phosphoglycolate phosphatase [Pseudoalteromonas carrageenovora]MDO6635864.1 phosphoglycolate phosphatase [Pseudoalteromonas carrageenovora]MDO6647857.1 phosphoglycolate phosphatase [Pseudoalteromonas carrageenovora]
MKYDVALFDLDGTLVDSVYDLYIAINLTLSDLAFPIVSQSLVESWVGNGVETLVMRALSGDMQISVHLDEALSNKAITLFYQHYEQQVGEYSVLYQHVETGLSALRGMPKALITNKARIFTEKLLDKLSLTSHFEVIVCGDDMAKKPSPEPLLFACNKLNVEPSKAIMIGDSKSDILAAHAAKIDVIALNYGYNQGEKLSDFNPQYLCDNFLDIIPTLTQR